MHLEIAIIPAKDGNAQALIEAMNKGGKAALLSCPGCNSVKVLPGVENPGKVVFLVEWDSVDAHNAARSSEGFANFHKIGAPFFSREGGGMMEHFDLG